MKQYDYIFFGAGCAAFSLLLRMSDAGLLENKRVLLLDRSPGTSNARTWCFWENGQGYFEPVVLKQWQQLWFHSPGFSRQLPLAPFSYKMIRGADFYGYCLEKLRHCTGIEFMYGELGNVSYDGTHRFTINGNEQHVSGAIAFSSIYDRRILSQPPAVTLLQHFKGWMIETSAGCFDAETATLMDYRVSQVHGSSFVYVLPLSDRRALVEFTVFSAATIPDNDYDHALRTYIDHQLKLDNYQVLETEKGCIPMTSAQFPWYGAGMYHIGTAGGQTKGSSGYTFQFIQRQSAAIVEQMLTGRLSTAQRPGGSPARFAWYDAVMLRVLIAHPPMAASIFRELFEKNDPSAIFSFLDNEPALAREFNIIRRLPRLPFMRAAWKQFIS